MNPKTHRSQLSKFFTAALFLSGGILLFSANLPAAPAREISVIAAASTSFKKNPEWQKEIRDRILFANGIFEKQFGIHFTIKAYRDWDPEDEKRETTLLIEELRSRFTLGHDEVVMGFHKMSQPFGQEVMEDLDTIGTAQFFRGFVILRDPYQDLSALQRQIVTTHEMAHLFGAIHIADPDQIMHRSLPQQPALELDAENKEIIETAKQVDFQVGVGSLLPASIDKLTQIYERLIRKNPNSDFYYQLGHFYEVRGLYSRAIAVWEEALRYEYTNPVIHWELGRHYYESSRYDLAIRELGTAVAHFILPSQKRQRAQTFNFLGVAYYRKGNLEQAIFNWLKGLSSDPDNLELQGNLAAAYMENGDVDRGITELLKLTAKFPDDTTTLSNLSVAYLKKKDYAKSVDYAKQALRKFELSEQTKQIREAQQKQAGGGEVEKELKGRLMPDLPAAILYSNLGAAYLGLKEWDAGLEALLKAQKMDEKDPEILQNLAYAYTQKKDYENAIPTIKDALALSPQNAQLRYFLAEALAMTGRRTEAVQAARSALTYADPSLKSNLHKNIAIMYAQENRADEAIAELKTSLSVNWNDADTHLKLGYLYGQTGKYDDARRSFQNAVRMDPQNAEAKKALDSVPAR